MEKGGGREIKKCGCNACLLIRCWGERHSFFCYLRTICIQGSKKRVGGQFPLERLHFIYREWKKKRRRRRLQSPSTNVAEIAKEKEGLKITRRRRKEKGGGESHSPLATLVYKTKYSKKKCNLNFTHFLKKKPMGSFLSK